MKFILDKYFEEKKPITKVPKTPPIKPSHVFLGDNLIKGVFPKKKPKK